MAPPAAPRLTAARERLDTLDWYPERVSLLGVRIRHAPWLFRLPGMRRFDGYATWRQILLRKPLAETSDALITHELCHIWQMQHAPVRMPLSYLARGYRHNPYERQARSAAALTARRAPPPAG
jgi:hypothetical protein